MRLSSLNKLPNKSYELCFEYDILEKKYKLSCWTAEDTKHMIYETPYLAEIEGVVVGLSICNDYDRYGKSTHNPMYRYTVKPKYNGQSADRIPDMM